MQLSKKLVHDRQKTKSFQHSRHPKHDEKGGIHQIQKRKFSISCRFRGRSLDSGVGPNQDSKVQGCEAEAEETQVRKGLTLHKSGCASGFISPRWGELFGCFEIPRSSVNSRFNQNEAELCVLIFAIPFQVLSQGNGFLDEEVKTFWKTPCKTVLSQNPCDGVAAQKSKLRNAVLVSKFNANLRRL